MPQALPPRPEVRAYVVALALAAALAATPLADAATSYALPVRCAATTVEPTPPYYRPGAPLRSSVGRGYRLQGTVREAGTCRPLAHARIEFFLANPAGRYDSAHRGTVLASSDGVYRIESNFPGQFHALPPHIHIRASAARYVAVMTEYRPQKGSHVGTFDLALRRRR